MKLLSLFLPATLLLAVFACSDEDDAGSPRTPDTDRTEDASTTPPVTDDAAMPAADSGTSDGATADFVLTAPWAEGTPIGAPHVCANAGGANGSPALSWTGAPAGTQSFAIVMRDESLSRADNYHWVIFDIPATANELPARLARTATVSTPVGARQTKWSFGDDFGYGGPCPPAGAPHNYRITLHALRTRLDEPAINPESVDAAVKAASIASVSVLGTFGR